MLLLEYKGKIYTCEYCNKRTINRKSFIAHHGSCRKKHLGEPRYNKRNNNKNRFKNLIKDYTCICGRIFKSTQSYVRHCGSCKIKHPELELKNNFLINGHAWNKGLTKEISESVKKYGESNSRNAKFGLHKLPVIKDKVSYSKKVSEGMKRAHAEGRAWNWAKSRKGKEPSYPEKVFMTYINENFNNKNYEREYSFYTFSLDFAWVNEKKCIEIDGSQHERFKEQIESDTRKDKKLIENGWKILRIKVRDLYMNPQLQINIAKKFIDE